MTKRLKFKEVKNDRERLAKLKKIFSEAPGKKAELASKLGYLTTNTLRAWFVTGSIPHYRRPEVDAFLQGA
jgi:hypothetical protein